MITYPGGVGEEVRLAANQMFEISHQDRDSEHIYIAGSATLTVRQVC